ncbi:MAG: amylo-alpha-1,6-glucosidase [Bacteroidales bacterium]|nr:amylo-alpha-1,6-glucosidase [Bacteroidales bacterium]MDZ4204945.1 amylo-alpha-1,6-glucosidase [Bacteroidales bacterium]
MSYISFDKLRLINLEYSLPKELLRSNRAGSYASTTIISCNTRKYHGLLVAPQPGIDDDLHVMLSSLDETVIQREAEFNLAIHKFKGEHYHPGGHKYLRDFTTEPIPKLTYRVGGVFLTKEVLFTNNDDKAIIKYTLEDAHSPTKIRFRPLLAFRSIHALSKANVLADTKFEPLQHGIKVRMYPGYSPLFLQFNKTVRYTHAPDWYFDFEYIREKLRGYECHEDLFTSGYFEAEIEKGESIYFVAGLSEADPSKFIILFDAEVKSRTPRNSYESCLINSAQQFVVQQGDKTEILAGYPWFGRRGRDTFISLPGLTLLQNDTKTFEAVLDTIIGEMNGPLFPNVGKGSKTLYNSVDAPLWFIWALQKYVAHTGNPLQVWKKYGTVIKSILQAYRVGSSFNIHSLENGLLYAGEPYLAVTWMDAVIADKPVVDRTGLAIEVNALWYNAIMFALELAKGRDKAFTDQWKHIAISIPPAFSATFWDPKRKYLADVVMGMHKDWSVRPNMVIAASLDYNPVDEEIRKSLLDIVRSELLTPRGLRTLSPKDPKYQSIYAGDQAARDTACYQGTAWPWLLGHFAEAYLKIHGRTALPLIEKISSGMEETLSEHAIGSISELFDGDPPHKPGGAISMAWSVAEVMRMNDLIKKYKASYNPGGVKQ